MIQITFTDTETTGVSNNDKVFNVGNVYTVVDENTEEVRIIDYENIFNEVTRRICAQAQFKTGFSQQDIINAAGGRKAEDTQKQLKNLFCCSACIGGYNTHFDIRMMKNTYSLPEITLIPTVDVKSMYSKTYSLTTLENAVAKLNINVDEAYGKLTKGAKGKYHSALYDSLATLLLYAKLRNFNVVYD